MAKPKRKVSKVVVVGVVTTSNMCFNCHCHQQSERSIKPYQRLTKRRRAFRYRSRSGLPFKYRFDFTSRRRRLKRIIMFAWRSLWFNGLLLSFDFNAIYPPVSPCCNRKPGDSSGSRQIRNTPDWSDNAVAGDHLWVPTSVSGDCCYVGDSDCTVSSSSFTPELSLVAMDMCRYVCAKILAWKRLLSSHPNCSHWFSVNSSSWFMHRPLDCHL